MGHVKPECPILKLKQKLKEKGVADKHKKKRKAYNSDSSSSNESDGNIEEETNLCPMAVTGYSKSTVSSFNSNDDENNNYELLDAFNELHKELAEENENLISSLEKLEKSKKDSDEGLTPTKDEGKCLRRLSMFIKKVH